MLQPVCFILCNHVFVTGELTRYMEVEKRIKHFQHFEDLLKAVDKILVNEPLSTVLVKGSRFMKMERVVNHLLETNSKIDK